MDEAKLRAREAKTLFVAYSSFDYKNPDKNRTIRQDAFDHLKTADPNFDKAEGPTNAQLAAAQVKFEAVNLKSDNLSQDLCGEKFPRIKEFVKEFVAKPTPPAETSTSAPGATG